MIFSAIEHIASQLNRFLKRTFELNEDIVLVSNLVESDGSEATHVHNKIVVFLVSLEKDTTPYQQNGIYRSESGQMVTANEPLFVNMFLMVAANFGGVNYPEALKFLSQAIQFFHKTPVFDHQNSPELDAGIEKLILTIENVKFHDLHSLWGVLNGKYLPSILYKVRMLTFDGDEVEAFPISDVQVDVRPSIEEI